MHSFKTGGTTIEYNQLSFARKLYMYVRVCVYLHAHQCSLNPTKSPRFFYYHSLRKDSVISSDVI